MLLECEHPARPADAPSILYAGACRRRPEALTASYLIRGAASGPVEPARLGTLEHFLVERYLLYAHAEGRVFQGRVHHRPYPLQPAKLLSLDETLLAAAGLERPWNPHSRTMRREWMLKSSLFTRPHARVLGQADGPVSTQPSRADLTSSVRLSHCRVRGSGRFVRRFTG